MTTVRGAMTPKQETLLNEISRLLSRGDRVPPRLQAASSAMPYLENPSERAFIIGEHDSWVSLANDVRWWQIVHATRGVIIDPLETESRFAWTFAKWAESGCCWFKLDEDLFYALASTDTKGLYGSDIRMPLPAFAVELPFGVLSLYDDIDMTGMRSTRTLLVSECAPTAVMRSIDAEFNGRGSLHVFAQSDTCARNGIAEVSHFYWDTPTFSDSMTVDAMTDAVAEAYLAATAAARAQGKRTSPNVTRTPPYHSLFGKPASNVDVKVGLQRFLLNLLLFLTSEQAQVDRVWPKKQKGRRAGRKIDLAAITQTSIIRSKVVIDKAVRKAVMEGQLTQRSLTVKTIVRGHYRRQACGPHFSERKLIWIAPHIRGKDLATALRGHDYEVKR